MPITKPASKPVTRSRSGSTTLCVPRVATPPLPPPPVLKRKVFEHQNNPPKPSPIDNSKETTTACKTKTRTTSTTKASDPAPNSPSTPVYISSYTQTDQPPSQPTPMEIRLRKERDDLIDNSKDLRIRIEELEEKQKAQVELITRLSAPVSTQTSPRKRPWREATVKNVETKIKRSIFSNVSSVGNDFENVSASDFFASINCQEDDLSSSRKSTVTSIYCFLEAVDVAVAFAWRVKNKFLLSPGLSKILPGKPKYFSEECWHGLPTVEVTQGVFTKCIVGEKEKKVLILEASDLENAFQNVVLAFDHYATSQSKPFYLGVDYFWRTEPELPIIKNIVMLSIVRGSSEKIKFLFYSRALGDLCFLVISEEPSSGTRLTTPEKVDELNAHDSIKPSDLPPLWGMIPDDVESGPSSVINTIEPISTVDRLHLEGLEKENAKLNADIEKLAFLLAERDNIIEELSARLEATKSASDLFNSMDKFKSELMDRMESIEVSITKNKSDDLTSRVKRLEEIASTATVDTNCKQPKQKKTADTKITKTKPVRNVIKPKIADNKPKGISRSVKEKIVKVNSPPPVVRHDRDLGKAEASKSKCSDLEPSALSTSLESKWLTDDDLNLYFEFLSEKYPRTDVALLDPIFVNLLKFNKQEANKYFASKYNQV